MVKHIIMQQEMNNDVFNCLFPWERRGIKELSALLLHILHVFPPLPTRSEISNLGSKEYAVCRFF